MFDHVTIRASDRARSERFYDTLLRGEDYYGGFLLDPDGNTSRPSTTARCAATA